MGLSSCDSNILPKSLLYLKYYARNSLMAFSELSIFDDICSILPEMLHFMRTVGSYCAGIGRDIFQLLTIFCLQNVQRKHSLSAKDFERDRRMEMERARQLLRDMTAGTATTKGVDKQYCVFALLSISMFNDIGSRMSKRGFDAATLLRLLHNSFPYGCC